MKLFLSILMMICCMRTCDISAADNGSMSDDDLASDQSLVSDGMQSVSHHLRTKMICVRSLPLRDMYTFVVYEGNSVGSLKLVISQIMKVPLEKLVLCRSGLRPYRSYANGVYSSHSNLMYPSKTSPLRAEVMQLEDCQSAYHELQEREILQLFIKRAGKKREGSQRLLDFCL